MTSQFASPAPAGPAPPGDAMLNHPRRWITILILGLSLAADLSQLLPGI